jgi:hypothetical protein
VQWIYSGSGKPNAEYGETNGTYMDIQEESIVVPKNSTSRE